MLAQNVRWAIFLIPTTKNAKNLKLTNWPSYKVLDGSPMIATWPESFRKELKSWTWTKLTRVTKSAQRKSHFMTESFASIAQTSSMLIQENAYHLQIKQQPMTKMWGVMFKSKVASRLIQKQLTTQQKMLSKILKLQIVNQRLHITMEFLALTVLNHSRFSTWIPEDAHHATLWSNITIHNTSVLQEISCTFQQTKTIWWRLQKCLSMIITPKLHKKLKIIQNQLFYYVNPLNIQIIRAVWLVLLMNILTWRPKNANYVMEL